MVKRSREEERTKGTAKMSGNKAAAGVETMFDDSKGPPQEPKQIEESKCFPQAPKMVSIHFLACTAVARLYYATKEAIPGTAHRV